MKCAAPRPALLLASTGLVFYVRFMYGALPIKTHAEEEQQGGCDVANFQMP